MNTSPSTIDQYISGFPPEIQLLLEQIRATIRQAAPEATEAIKYGMPTFVLKKNLVHFAACKNHIGFYPAPSAIIHFQKELSGFQQTKGSVHFPLDQPIPAGLVEKIVWFRVSENLMKSKTTKK